MELVTNIKRSKRREMECVCGGVGRKNTVGCLHGNVVSDVVFQYCTVTHRNVP